MVGRKFISPARGDTEIRPGSVWGDPRPNLFSRVSLKFTDHICPVNVGENCEKWPRKLTAAPCGKAPAARKSENRPANIWRLTRTLFRHSRGFCFRIGSRNGWLCHFCVFCRLCTLAVGFHWNNIIKIRKNVRISENCIWYISWIRL